jgi:SCY1-like protein 2
MGSSLFPNYTLEKKPYLVLKYWKIFKGVNKASGENISAFIFEKKELDKKNEKDKSNILFCLRKEPETLIRGKNKHKNFLKVIESLKEDNDSMGFITEYVNYNLITWANIYQPSKLEIKYIIYQLLSVVIFMHSEYHISHNNLNLDNIFITENNFVKITGFMFTTTLNNNNSNNSNNINLKKNLIEACCDMKYIAPELVLNNEISNSSDSFIIGLISYYLLGEKSNNDLFILTDNSYDSYKNTYKNSNIEKKINAFNNDLIKDYLKSLLQNNTEKRKNLSLIQNSKFFVESEDNSKLVPLCLLSKMESAEITNNYDLLKLLPNILDLYSIKEKEFLILPNLLYYLKIENLINPIVPALFLLSETTNNEINFEKKIWPTFKALFNMKKFPAITLYFTLKKVSFLINNLEKSEFNNHCIPLICKALDCGVQKIQDVILEELPKILKNIDKNEFQNKIYNRLVKIVIQTKNQKLRKKIMNFFIYLSDYFDSYFINNNFLDDIEKIIKSETTLNICKNAFTLYEKMKTKVNDKSVRSKIIPSLLLMMCNGEISEELFNKGENIIHSYIQKIKEKRKEQFLQDIENDSDENNSNKNINVIKKAEGNNKNISSPLSVARSKSTLSGNISLFGNSSEDSGLDLEQKKRSKKEKEKEKIKANKNKIELNNENNNLFDNLLNNNNEDMDNKNVDSSFDSISTGKNKNEFDLANKKEFLSSLKLKRIEKQQKLENKKTAGKTNTFNENKKNGWEEIESDDENTDELGKYIIKPKKSSEGKNNKKESDKKKSNRKKWDEEEEEDNDDNLNYKKNESESDFSKEKNTNENKKNEEIFHLNFDEYNNSIAVNPINTYLYDNIVNNNDMEKKEEIADNKNESIKDNNNDKDENNKKKIKKKKKHKKKDKDKTEDNKEKETKEAISTTKMRMNERAKNLDLDSLLDDD